MKAVVAAISVFGEWMFGAHVEALLVVFILLILDTVTGMIVACKKGGLSSAGFFRFAAKLSIYMILMATSSLLDKLLPVNAGSAIMYTFLGVTEAISIMENISILGFPVPIKLVRMLRVMSDTEFKKMKLTKKSSGDNKK